MFPKLFDLGPIPIHTYDVLLSTAILVAIYFASRLAEKVGISGKFVWDLGFIIIVSALAGAKLLLILTSFDYYSADLSRIFSVEFLRAGGVYYGGLLGAILGSFVYIKWFSHLDFWEMADILAPAIPLGQAIGRLGCFSAGCDYGKPTDLPWGVTFTNQYAHELVGVPIGVSLHPYQLYESFVSVGIFFFLYWKFKRLAFRGQILSLYLILYGISRFFLEFFRGDLDRGFLFGGLLSTSQFISLLIVPAALAVYIYRRTKARV
jgi:phosphatidylglycerol:prolipoprotein diacylglycerol transferase